MDTYVIGLSYAALLLATLGWGIALILRWRWLPSFAGEVYESHIEKALLDSRIPKSDYVDAYVRAEGPRLASYRCGLALGFLVLLPILVPLLSRLTDWIWFQTGLSLGPSNVVQIALDFSVILTVMALLIGAVYLITMIYYRKRPPSLRAEVRRLRAEAGVPETSS